MVRQLLAVLGTGIVGLLGPTAPGAGGESQRGLPNVVLAIADDWSWPHASAAGDPVVQTPTFDRVAAEGVLFTNAHVGAPTCSASRATILTGQHAWRLAEAANLHGTFPGEFQVFTDLLQEGGYHVGFVGKGWGPGLLEPGGRTVNPAGKKYTSFTSFLHDRPAGAPFCFWFGSRDPHRPYEMGSGLASGMNPQNAQLPTSLPDAPEVRNDMLDYYFAVQRFDQQVGDLLATIDAMGELDDTLFVVTSDNGMPFPRAKANLYDTGTHVPLAIRWPAQVPGGRSVTDFVSLADLAPTFLESAGIAVPSAMTATSLTNILTSSQSGQIDPTRDSVLIGRERHTPGQPCTPAGYPMRAIRTQTALYIRNYKPLRWPAGTADGTVSYVGTSYSDVDESPTKTYIVSRQGDPTVKPFFDLAFELRPREELYDLVQDPGELVNVAAVPQYAELREQLSARLHAALAATGDPRAAGGGEAFDQYPYYGRVITPPLTTNVDELDPFVHGAQIFTLDAGPAYAFYHYAVLGSLSGTSPGTSLGGVLVPLNPDPYLQLTMSSPALFFVNSVGTLDASGRATATLPMPANPAFEYLFLPGQRLHHAYVLSTGEPPSYALASNPCQLRMLYPPR